jgi:hypothetical protein
MPDDEENKFGVYDWAGWYSLIVPFAIVLIIRLAQQQWPPAYCVFACFILITSLFAGLLGCISFERLSTRLVAVIGMTASILVICWIV